MLIKVQDNGPGHITKAALETGGEGGSCGTSIARTRIIRCRKTDRIIYADGNPQNLDRDNLIKLSGAEYITYTHLRGVR